MVTGRISMAVVTVFVMAGVGALAIGATDSQPSDAIVGEGCPDSLKELEETYLREGREPQGEGPCALAEDAHGLSDAEGPAEDAPVAPASDASLSEAQKEFDPDNDPSIVVGKNEDGTFEVTHFDLIPGMVPEGYPTPEEAGVKTPADLREWAAMIDDAILAERRGARE